MLWFIHCAAGERQPGCWRYGIQGSVTPEKVQRKGRPGLLWISVITRGAQDHVNIKANKSTSIKLCKPIKCSSPDTGLVWWWKAWEVCQGITDLFFQAIGTSIQIKDPKTLASDLEVFSLGEGLRQQTWTRCQENQGRAAVVAVALLLRESRGKAHRTLALIALH